MAEREYRNYNILDDVMEDELIEEEQEHKNEPITLLSEKKTQAKVELDKKDTHNLNQQKLEEIQIKPINELEINNVQKKDNKEENIIHEINESEGILQVQEKSKEQEASSMVRSEKTHGGQEKGMELKVNKIEEESIEKENSTSKEAKQAKEIPIQQSLFRETNEEKKEANKQKDKGRVAVLTKSEDRKKDKNKSEKEKALVHKNFFSKEEQRRDDDIPEYKRYYQQKERSGFFKWCLRLAKFSIIVMLLPFIAVIGAGVLGVILGFLCTIGTLIGTGIFILGAICFISSQVSISIIGLGISVAITCMAFGGIVLILFILLMKWSLKVVRKYRKPRSKTNNKEVD